MSTTETVDIMTLTGVGSSGSLRVTKVLRNGKRWSDPIEKERLIDAALEPGSMEKRSLLVHEKPITAATTTWERNTGYEGTGSLVHPFN